MLYWSKGESVLCFELKQLSKANLEQTITLRKKENLSTLSIFILQSLAQHHYKQTIQTCHSLSNFTIYNLLHNHTWAKPFLEFARAAHGITAPKWDFCLLLEWKRFWNITNSFATWKKIFRLIFFFMFILKVVFHSKLWGKKGGQESGEVWWILAHLKFTSKVTRATNQLGGQADRPNQESAGPPEGKEKWLKDIRGGKIKNLSPSCCAKLVRACPLHPI